MKFSLLDGGEGGKYIGAGFVEISKIFATQDVFLFEKEPFDRV